MKKRGFSFPQALKPAFVISLLIAILPGMVSAVAEDSAVSLVIAPPPVGYPAIEAGKRTTQIGVNGLYAAYSANGFDMTFFGVGMLVDAQQCPSDRIALNGSIGFSALAGDKYNMIVAQFPFNGDVIFKLAGNNAYSLFAFGGATGSLGLTTMTINIPQWVPYTTTFVNDDTTLTTTIMTVTGLGGLQANIPISSFIVSPFGFCTITGGSWSSTQTSSMSYSYPSSSGSIDPMAGFVLGFDVLYVPLNFALSSQFHRDSDFTLITVASKWKIGK